MSLYDWKWAQDFDCKNCDPPFYGLLFVLIRRADTLNLELLRQAWPELVEEAQRRYNARGGRLSEDGEI